MKSPAETFSIFLLGLFANNTTLEGLVLLEDSAKVKMDRQGGLVVQGDPNSRYSDKHLGMLFW